MKKYIYELMYLTNCGLGIEENYAMQIGFFSSLPEIRVYIIEDGSPRDKFRAYRHTLNPQNAEQDAVAVEIKWEK